ncbi:MAG: formate dehydrogenase [Gammaproteobacteria bacterium]|nr:formate dehydrogenase [Gammaproteobacteria bacterium]
MKHQHLDEKPARTRRAFLKGAAAAAGVAGVAGVTGAAAADLPAAESTTAPAAAGDGYRETAHIRAYYRAARF